MYRGKWKREPSEESRRASYQERLFRETHRRAPPAAPVPAPLNAPEEKPPARRAGRNFGEFFSALDPEDAALVILILFLLVDREEPDVLLVGALLYLLLGK